MENSGTKGVRDRERRKVSEKGCEILRERGERENSDKKKGVRV